MICVIPARKGSTRIPLKNIKEFHGKPIIEYSIETAKQSRLFEKIYISTDIEYLLSKYPAGNYAEVEAVRRNPEYCKNEVGTQEVIGDFIKELDIRIDVVCCIYPCSPLLKAEDLRQAKRLLSGYSGMLYAFSVGTNPLRDAGNFYMGFTWAFADGTPVHGEHSIMVPLPEERVCDINTMDDWSEAEEKYRKLYGETNER